MKKILLGLVVLLSLSVNAQIKIGFVDTERVLDTLPSRKVAAEKYMAFENELRQEISAMAQEIEKLYVDYEKNKINNSPVMNQAAERKIMEKEKAIQERDRTAAQDLQAYSNELNDPIFKRVEDAIKLIAERKKLTMVVDKGSTLYFEEASDISNEVITEVLKTEKL